MNTGPVLVQLCLFVNSNTRQRKATLSHPPMCTLIKSIPTLEATINPPPPPPPNSSPGWKLQFNPVRFIETFPLLPIPFTLCNVTRYSPSPSILSLPLLAPLLTPSSPHTLPFIHSFSVCHQWTLTYSVPP